MNDRRFWQRLNALEVVILASRDSVENLDIHLT